MKLSINTALINKNETKLTSQAKGFIAANLTVAQLADHIRQGHAMSFQFRNDYRNTENFLCSDMIAADVDDGMTLEDALADPFIQKNACLIYTSASHTVDNHRFRIVFETPHTITDRDEMRTVLRGLIRKFRSDGSAKDAARQFYGSRDCTTYFPGGRLDQTDFDLLIELGAQPLNVADSPNRKLTAGSRSDLLLAPDQLVMTTQGEQKLLSEMEGSKSVFCPYHQDKNPSAFTTRSKHGVIGIHCSSCQLTFWPQGNKPPAYDFFVFDKMADEAILQPPELMVDESGLFDVEIANPNKVLSQRYLPARDIDPFDGITLVKSPKGSGKTEYLSELLRYCEQQQLKVLLIGHRRALIRALAQRLDMHYYLDPLPGRYFPDRYAISVDSLATILVPEFHKFQVVLIDESEQVFSHLLSKTMDNDSRRRSYLILRHYAETARQVVALDADLNEVTLHAIQRFSEKKPFLERRLILNRYQQPNSSIELYADEKHLIEVLFADIASGRRLFICCNTKKQVETFGKILTQQYGDQLAWLSITSANSQTQPAIDFMKAPATQILQYQVMLVSPAVSSGIDITFPDNASLIDCVYGFFQPLINAHYDIDQQISRVRHPGCVRLWLTPQIFNFESETDPIYQELAASSLFPHMLKGYTRQGVRQYDWDDPFTRLYATILSSQRASKNHLKQNLVHLRQYNGWSFVEVERDKLASARGNVIAQTGRDLRLAARINDLLAADALDSQEVDDLLDMRGKEIKLSHAQNMALERFFIERFYHEPITAGLIEQDNESHFREQIRQLEAVYALSETDISRANPNGAPELLYRLFHLANLMPAPQTFDTKAILTTVRLQAFINFCLKEKVRIERVLNRDIRKDITWKPITQLNGFLELCGLTMIKCNTIAVGKTKIYEYRLTPGLQPLLSIVERRRLAKSADSTAHSTTTTAPKAVVQPIDI